MLNTRERPQHMNPRTLKRAKSKAPPKLNALNLTALKPRTPKPLPIGPIVVPFWGYLLEFYI